MARILVVDDESTVRRVVRRMLETCGHSIEEATDGQEALESCIREAFDLVITDIQMPRLDGFGLIRELKRRSGDTRIFALTGEGPEALIEAREAGASYGFAKPFKVDKVLAAVQETLG